MESSTFHFPNYVQLATSVAGYTVPTRLGLIDRYPLSVKSIIATLLLFTLDVSLSVA